MARVSIVIPTYNYAHWLGGAIDSALSQEPGDLEVIVVDDGSTDGTADVVAAYRRADSRVRYLSQVRDGYGCIRAINRGVAAAGGAWFCWLSSDDRFLPGKLKAQLGTGADFSYTDYRIALEPGVPAEVFRHIRVPPEAARDAEGALSWVQASEPGDLLRRNFINGCTVMIRMELLRSMGPLDESLRHTADYELWLRMERAGVRFVHVPRAYTRTRIHGTNTALWPTMEREAARVRASYAAAPG
jgi:glycosyltransferase involved in cell wall biosynthesis